MSLIGVLAFWLGDAQKLLSVVDSTSRFRRKGSSVEDVALPDSIV